LLKFFLISAVLSAYLYSQNISGYVTGFPFNVPLENVAVTVKDNITGQTLGTDSTDAQGNYSIDYVPVNVRDEFIPTGYYLSNPYPQPFNPQTKIDFYTPVYGTYTIGIFSITGERVYQSNMVITPGNHSFTISGLGAAGVYLFSISSDNFSAARKLLLLDGGSNNIKVSVGADNHLRKHSVNDLLIEFRKDGFYNKDSIISFQQNIIMNAELNQVPVLIQINITGQQTNEQTDEPVKNASYTLKKKNGDNYQNWTARQPRKNQHKPRSRKILLVRPRQHQIQHRHTPSRIIKTRLPAKTTAKSHNNKQQR
jgi:hypothetical protein